jgi:hypothetical protein
MVPRWARVAAGAAGNQTVRPEGDTSKELNIEEVISQDPLNVDSNLEAELTERVGPPKPN